MSLDFDVNISEPFPASGGRRTVEIALKPTGKTRVTNRHVVLLVDTSSSMRWPEEKIERARAGIGRVIDELDDDDHVSIIAFNSTIDVVAPLQRWGSADQTDIRKAVLGSDSSDYDGELEASGGTDIVSGLEEARSQFDNAPSTGQASKNIILLSDGKDSHDIEIYENLASDIGDDGISIMAGGIGSNYNERVMTTISSESGGEPYAIENANDIDTFLEEQIKEAADVVAQNPTARVETGDEFILDGDESAVFTEPQAQSEPIRDTDRGGSFDLPRLTVGKRQLFSFVVLGTPQPTGFKYHMMDFIIKDGNGRVLAQEEVSAAYDDDGQEKAAVNRRRESAKIARDVSDPSVGTEKIKADIKELEKKGWSETAADLEKRLDDDDVIGVTKALIEEE